MANTENIGKWVEALRSGDYKQGTGALLKVREDGTEEFCCLGVACQISGVVSRLDRGELRVPAFVSNEDPDDNNAGTLPDAVVEWLGIESVNPTLTDENGRSDATSVWNDVEDADFDKIADLIELKYLRAA